MRLRLFILILLLSGCERPTDVSNDRVESIMNNAFALYQDKQYNEAIDSMNKAALILADNGSPEQLANCFNRLGLLYWALKDTASSISYYNRSLGYAKEVSTDLQAKILTGLGNRFSEIENFIKANYYYSQVDSLHLPLTSPNYYSNLVNKGNIYLKFGLYTKARIVTNIALQFFKSKHDTENINICYIILMACDVDENKSLDPDYTQIDDEYFRLNLCEAYIKLKEYSKSDSLSQLLLSHPINDFVEAKAYCLNGVSQLKQGNNQNSIKLLTKSFQLMDTLNLAGQKEILGFLLANFKSIKNNRKINNIETNLSSLDSKIDLIREKSLNEITTAQKVAQYQSSMLTHDLENINFHKFIFKFYFVFIFALFVIVFLSYLSFNLKMRVKSLKSALDMTIIHDSFNFYNKL